MLIGQLTGSSETGPKRRTAVRPCGRVPRFRWAVDGRRVAQIVERTATRATWNAVVSCREYGVRKKRAGAASSTSSENFFVVRG